MNANDRVRNSPPWHWIVGCGCGGCLLVLLLAGIGGYFAFQAGSKAASDLDPVGRRFIGQIYADQTDSAWAMVSDEWKRTSNREDFEKWTDSVRRHFNGSPAISREGFQFYRGTGGSFEILTFHLKQGGASARLTIRFVRQNGKIRISAANLSPASSTSP